jgi:hypothetical protein
VQIRTVRGPNTGFDLQTFAIDHTNPLNFIVMQVRPLWDVPIMISYTTSAKLSLFESKRKSSLRVKTDRVTPS